MSRRLRLDRQEFSWKRSVLSCERSHLNVRYTKVNVETQQTVDSAAKAAALMESAAVGGNILEVIATEPSHRDIVLVGRLPISALFQTTVSGLGRCEVRVHKVSAFRPSRGHVSPLG